MAKVTFPCPQCGKVTAVREEFLGKQVRCPHCQQIIPAPASAPESPAEPPPAPSVPAGSPEPPGAPEFVISVAPPVAEGSIFDTEEETGDALFGGPAGPLVEMPPAPAVPNLTIEAAPPPEPPVSNFQVEAAPPPEPSPAEQAPPSGAGLPFEPSVSYVAENAPASDTGLDFSAAPPAPEAPADAPVVSELPPPETAPEGEPPVPTVTAPIMRPTRGGTLVPTLLIFLIPYCIVSTIAVVMLYMKVRQGVPSLEYLPDSRPDKKAGGPARVGNHKRVGIGSKVPPKLIGKLHQAIRVGDLEVVPEKVEWAGPDRLRLVVRLRNVSKDLEFNPVDNHYLHFSRIDPDDPRPYTYLEEVGTNERIYGGSWETFRQGQPSAGRLGPDEELTAQLTTDPRDAGLVANLKEFAGPLLWRIQVRRGLVEYNGKEYSATAVVGVEFQVGDVRKGPEAA